MLESAKKSVPELTNRIDERKRELEKEQSSAKKQHTKLEELRCDRDILINSFLRQEDLENSRNEVLKSLILTNQELEEELNRILKQEQNLNRETTSLELERALKVSLTKLILY